MIHDFRAAINQSTNLFDKNDLLSKVEIDRMQRTESFETFTQIVQTLICDFFTPVIKSTNLYEKVADHEKLRLADCKELSLLRLSPRNFRP